MNILFIPSWYPSKNKPNAGIFFKEWFLAMGEIKTNRAYISLIGDGDYDLPLKNPFNAVKNLARFLKAHRSFVEIGQNTWEITSPLLYFSPAIFGYQIGRMFKVTEANFLKARGEAGHIDLIHAHVCFPAGYLAMMLARKYRIPYLITENMGPFPFKNFLEKGKLSRLISDPIKRSNLTIAASTALQKKMEKFGFKKIRTLPNYVDEEYFYPLKPRYNQNFIFFTLGDISESKGIGELILAAKKVIDKNPKVIFRIGGSGKDLKKYQKLSEELGVASNIRWLGPLSRPLARRYFQTSDAFVLASHYENFGMVYAEALACGKPVIATRCGGPEDMIKKENGLLVPVGNIEKLSEAMLNLVGNRQKYKTNVIRADFMKRFSKRAVVKEIMSLYSKILKKKQF